MIKNEAKNFIMGETIGYVRVSSREQQLSGYSINDQVRKIIEYCDRHNIDIEEENIIIDPGKSAGSLKRKGLQTILRALPKGMIKRIIVKNSSSLTRDNINKYSLKHAFDRYDVEVVCLEGKWKADNPNEEIGTDIQVFIDSHNRKQVSPDTIKGMKESAIEGNYSLGGLPPRGYKRVKKDNGSVYLVPIEEYRKDIIYIFESLKQRTNTLSGLAKLYNKNKVMGKYWTDNAVTSIFNNPIYYGTFQFRDLCIENHTEPIISKELYVAAHEAQKVLTRVPKHFYIYGGLIYCEKCHSFCVKESVIKKKKIYIYYRCPVCGKRINETKLNEEVATVIDLQTLPKEKYEMIVELEKKIKRKQSRIHCYENDYDDFLIEDDELREKTVLIRKEILQLKNEIELIKNFKTKQFKSLSKVEQRKKVQKILTVIKIDFETNTIKCVEKKNREYAFL